MKKIYLIFLLALTLRLAMIFVWHQTGHGSHLPGDAMVHYYIAQNMIEGEGFQIDEVPTTRRPPLFPFLIAGMLQAKMFPLGIHLLQAILGAASSVLLYGMTKYIFDEKAATVAGLIYGIDYMSVRQTVAVMPEVLFVFFMLLSFYSLLRAKHAGNNSWIFTAGLFSGCMLLTKDTLLPYLVFVCAWFFLWEASRKMSAFRGAVFLLGILAVSGPWMVRNSLVHGRPVFITTGSAHSFYLGNNPLVQVNTSSGEWEYGKDTEYFHDPPEGYYRWSLEADRYYFGKALEFIREHPAQFFSRMGQKIVKMWRPYAADSPPAAKAAALFCYLGIMGFAARGMALSKDQWRELFPFWILILYIAVLHAVTIAAIRYRFPAMPLFIMFASYGIVHGMNQIRHAGQKFPAAAV